MLQTVAAAATTAAPVETAAAAAARCGPSDAQSFRVFPVDAATRQVEEGAAAEEAAAANAIADRVCETYRIMHTEQTFDFVQRKKAKWSKLDHAEMTVFEALELINTLVDASDPDVDFPNSYHAFQTAERIRAEGGDEWFQLTGLIHDLGKVLALWGEPQWCVVGDTFPVGAAFQDCCVYPQHFQHNPDSADERYNTKYGVYHEGIGLDNVHFSFGHDEYMYQVLAGNNTTLPYEALFIIRYHSFYPWHTAGGYDHLCNDKDREMLRWVKEFNRFDLYSKGDDLPDVDALMPYYQRLVDRYLPGKLKW